VVEECNDWASVVGERGENRHQKEALILKARESSALELVTAGPRN
jgi:hypothetical protein